MKARTETGGTLHLRLSEKGWLHAAKATKTLQRVLPVFPDRLPAVKKTVSMHLANGKVVCKDKNGTAVATLVPNQVRLGMVLYRPHNGTVTAPLISLEGSL